MTPTSKKFASIIALSLLGGVSLAQAASPIWDGTYSSEQASRGEAVYSEACLACHGQDLGGNSNSPGLKGMGFMFLWEGRTVGEFFEKIRSEMPTDRPAQLPVQNYLDVVAYILQENGFPAAATELTNDVDALNAISIVPKP